ncbi:hypothetical protein Hanom_Chr07g00589701 [Helianthus anomalus]
MARILFGSPVDIGSIPSKVNRLGCDRSSITKCLTTKEIPKVRNKNHNVVSSKRRNITSDLEWHKQNTTTVHMTFQTIESTF